jgi:hypothetical protein
MLLQAMTANKIADYFEERAKDHCTICVSEVETCMLVSLSADLPYRFVPNSYIEWRQGPSSKGSPWVLGQRMSRETRLVRWLRVNEAVALL